MSRFGIFIQLLLIAVASSKSGTKKKHNDAVEIDNLIILVGLPNSGTTSVHLGLLDLGIKSAHWVVDDKLCSHQYPVNEVVVGSPAERITWNKIREANRCYIGVLIQKAISDDLPPLEHITDAGYQAVSQMDVCDDKDFLSIFPQVDAIENLAAAYPDAYFILTRRASTKAHVESMISSGLLDLFQDTGWLERFQDQSTSKSDAENGEIMVEEMTSLMLNAFVKYPDVKFLDVTVEVEGAASQIAAFLGLSAFPLGNIDQMDDDEYEGDDVMAAKNDGADGEKVENDNGVSDKQIIPVKIPSSVTDTSPSQQSSGGYEGGIFSSGPKFIAPTPSPAADTPSQSSGVALNEGPVSSTADPMEQLRHTSAGISWPWVLAAFLGCACSVFVVYRRFVLRWRETKDGARAYKPVLADSDSDEEKDDCDSELNPFILEMTDLPKRRHLQSDDEADRDDGIANDKAEYPKELPRFQPFDLNELGDAEVADDEFSSNRSF